MKIEDPFLDTNGLVLPNPKSEEKPSDNGVFFTSIAKFLGFDIPNYKELIRECYLFPGLIARWKGNNWDNCAWDDYLGIAATCVKFEVTDIPREILSYGIKHFFFYNTNGKLEGKDFLGRNLPIWPIMFCAGFPKLKFLAYPACWAVQLFFKTPDLSDTSGIQLQWIYLKACECLGFKFKKLKEHEDIIKEAFKIYYSKDHPFNLL